jgi:hypothetical protein
LQDFGHVIHELSFGTEEEFHAAKDSGAGRAVKQIMGVTDPLTGLKAHTETSQYMFQVSTSKITLKKFQLTQNPRTLTVLSKGRPYRATPLEQNGTQDPSV